MAEPPPDQHMAEPPPVQPPAQPQDARAKWDAEPAGSLPNPAYAPQPRAEYGKLVGRVVDASSRRFPGVVVRIVGSTTFELTTDESGMFITGELKPGAYRVIVVRQARPEDRPLQVDVVVEAGKVTPLAMLGEPDAAMPVPIKQACCMPYGAPPARRRVV